MFMNHYLSKWKHLSDETLIAGVIYRPTTRPRADIDVFISFTLFDIIKMMLIFVY